MFYGVYYYTDMDRDVVYTKQLPEVRKSVEILKKHGKFTYIDIANIIGIDYSNLWRLMTAKEISKYSKVFLRQNSIHFIIVLAKLITEYIEEGNTIENKWQSLSLMGKYLRDIDNKI